MPPVVDGLRYNRGVPDYLEPSTPMHIASVALHELYGTLVAVGFTETQAIALVATLIERTAYAK